MTNTATNTAIDLGGDWHLTDTQGEHDVGMSFPGDVINALHLSGGIPDPYWGRNEYDLRAIADRDWVASRVVTLDRTDLSLILSAVDTVAEVRLNGVLVMNCANAFRTYRADLSDVAVIGANTFEITFKSNTNAANAVQASQPYRVPFQQGNCPIPNGNMLRKPQCDFGWDWNIALAPFGIYGEMKLVPNSNELIDRIAIEQVHKDGAVTLNFTTHLNVNTAASIPWQIKFMGETYDGVADAPAGMSQLHQQVIVEDAALWYPAGRGEQPLHDLKIQVGSQTEHRRIGLRDIKLVNERDDIGLRFKFQVNGDDVFARGANWIPADALAGRITPEATRELLQSAVDANMNMIRIWGGGRYEPDWFYDICDELGLMVWQDFMFACHLYPATDEFFDEVGAEVRENVARVHHHACLALWCGDNELVGALTWFEESVKDRDRYLVAYDRLNRRIEQELKAIDPTGNWWPSSPSQGPLSFGDAWHDDSSGDFHFWSVWHEGRDFEHYRDVSPRFCSEFGFQSYPSMSAIRTFADPKDFNISAPVFESHQKNAGGNARIAETMFRYFRFPVDFENFVYLSQVQQGLAIKTAVSHWRSLKPHCMGTLIWQLNDTWPVCSWSSLDYGGGWKLLHHMAREFFQPILATVVPNKTHFDIRLVSDLAETQAVRVEAFAISMDGTRRDLQTADVSVGPDAAIEVLSIPQSALGENELLGFLWNDGKGGVASDVFAPRPYKNYDLLPAGLTQTATKDGDGFTIKIEAQNTALFVSLEADQPGRFSQNAFTVVPEHPVMLRFTPKTPKGEVLFTLRDLHSATYGNAK